MTAAEDADFPALRGLVALGFADGDDQAFGDEFEVARFERREFGAPHAGGETEHEHGAIARAAESFEIEALDDLAELGGHERRFGGGLHSLAARDGRDDFARSLRHGTGQTGRFVGLRYSPAVQL